MGRLSQGLSQSPGESDPSRTHSELPRLARGRYNSFRGSQDSLLPQGEIRMALSPWPERSTMPVAWPAAVRQLATSLNQSVPAPAGKRSRRSNGSLADDSPVDSIGSACIHGSRPEWRRKLLEHRRVQGMKRSSGESDICCKRDRERSDRRASMFWKSSIRRAMSAGGITAGPLRCCPPGTLREGGSSDELAILGEA